MSKGKLIVLEGLDGSGKGTQAKLLVTSSTSNLMLQLQARSNRESASWITYSDIYA